MSRGWPRRWSSPGGCSARRATQARCTRCRRAPPAAAPRRVRRVRGRFHRVPVGPRESDLQASAIAQARRIAGSLLDEVAVTRRAAGMRAGDAADRVRRFGERLAEVTVHGRDAVTVVNAESGRLLFALNDAAEEDRPRLAREVGGQLDELFGGSLREPRRPRSSGRAASGWPRSPWPPRRRGASSGGRSSSRGWPRWTPGWPDSSEPSSACSASPPRNCSAWIWPSPSRRGG